MPYDADVHHRRSIRLPAYDYRECGAYFVTVCTHERRCTLANPAIAAIVLETWGAIPIHFPNAAGDEIIVMPNHVHGIVYITVGATAPPRPASTTFAGIQAAGSHPAPAGRGSPSPLRPRLRPRGAERASLGAIIGSFKSYAARRINAERQTSGAPVWQRNYYERVIRNDRELELAREYILDNPRKWAEDKLNPINILENRRRGLAATIPEP